MAGGFLPVTVPRPKTREDLLTDDMEARISKLEELTPPLEATYAEILAENKGFRAEKVAMLEEITSLRKQVKDKSEILELLHKLLGDKQ